MGAEASETGIMIFEADASQIRQLDSTTLVRLMKLLMLAECRLVGIPLRSATVPVQITVPDGGEDGRVEWQGGADATDFFPSRFRIFQAKAQNLTATKIGAEVLQKPKRGKATLKPAVLEVLARRGAYIVFCSHPFTGQKIGRLRNAIETAIRDAGHDPGEAAAIEIYDANRIADWVNTHPAVALWLAAHSRRRSLAGFLTHEGWGKAADITGIPWVDDGAPRFAPVSRVIPAQDRKERRKNAWTFDQATDAVLQHLFSEKGVAGRISGPPGFGKTRFAYELFRSGQQAISGIQVAAVIFADHAVAGDEIPKLALEVADAGSPTILVVDECPDALHLKLVEIARRAGSRLRLLTLDVETNVAAADETLVVKLMPAAEEHIAAIAKAVAPKLSDSDLRFIKVLSQGYPQMAVLAAQRNADGRGTFLSVDQMVERIIWGTRPRNIEAQKALEFLSLFERVGLTERTGNQAACIATQFAGMTEADFVEHVRSFESRGVVVARGDFVQVVPIPLAARLAAHRLSVLPDGKLMTFFASAPNPLKLSLLRRMRWLDTTPEAKAFARALLASDKFGNLAALNTAFGAECADHLVHVDPDAAIAALDRVFGGLTNDQLRAVSDGRRHIVWALEKLVFRRASFESAATLLRRFGAAETEGRIANNASGQFKQLYQLCLSGTEVEPAVRLVVLDDGLRSSDPKERELCLDALDRMLRTHHFSRTSGAEEIGSAQRLRDWAPRTLGEIRESLRAAVVRLIALAISEDGPAGRAKQILGSHIRGLLSQLPLDEIKGMVGQITARFGPWPEAVQEVNEWVYFDRRKSPKALGREVRAYFDELMPGDPVDRVVLYTRGWQVDFHDPDMDYEREDRSANRHDYPIRQSVELADSIAADPALLDRALTRFATSDAKSVFPFARRLAELVADPVELFGAALGKAEASADEPNQQFFAGMISGTDARNPEQARMCMQMALRSEKLKQHAIAMIGSGKLQPRDIGLVVSLVRSGDIDPWRCAALSYGRGMDHLSAAAILPLLNELKEHGTDGLWAVLDIISMIAHGGKKLDRSILAVLKDVLVAPDLFEIDVQRPMDSYHLEVAVELLAKHRAIDGKFAGALVKQLLGICSRSEDGLFHAFDESVRKCLTTLMRAQQRPVWAGVTELLSTSDWLVRYQLDHLLEPPDDDYLGPGLLFSLDEQPYFDWVKGEPSSRAGIVVGWLPIAITSEDGSLSWHPALTSFVDEFGAIPEVLSALSRRLYPSTCWGSLTPHLEPLIPLLESWREHGKPEVRRWVWQKIEQLWTEIRREDLQNDE